MHLHVFTIQKKNGFGHGLLMSSSIDFPFILATLGHQIPCLLVIVFLMIWGIGLLSIVDQNWFPKASTRSTFVITSSTLFRRWCLGGSLAHFGSFHLLFGSMLVVLDSSWCNRYTNQFICSCRTNDGCGSKDGCGTKNGFFSCASTRLYITPRASKGSPHGLETSPM